MEIWVQPQLFLDDTLWKTGLNSIACFCACGLVDFGLLLHNPGLTEAMKNACADHNPIIVTSKNDNSVVIMSLEDYESLQETVYLLRYPKNMRRLLESIKQLETGHGKIKKI